MMNKHSKVKRKRLVNSVAIALQRYFTALKTLKMGDISEHTF